MYFNKEQREDLQKLVTLDTGAKDYYFVLLTRRSESRSLSSFAANKGKMRGFFLDFHISHYQTVLIVLLPIKSLNLTERYISCLILRIDRVVSRFGPIVLRN